MADETNNQTDQTGQTPAQTKGPWDTIGVSLDDMPIVGQKETPKSDGQPEVKTEEKQEAKKEEKTEEKPKDESATETDTEKGQPQTDTGESGKTVYTAANGRTFEDVDTLLKTYNESSNEGMKLNSELKTTKVQLDTLSDQLKKANETILSLQEYVGDGGYPNAKSETELADMTDEERTEYYLDKREWKNKVNAFKEGIEKAKKESEEYSKQVRQTIEQTETQMASDQNQFPEFAELKPVRDQILAQSPWLDNRAETPYITYLLAQGLVAIKTRELASKAAADSKAKAANTAKAESSKAGKTGGTEKGKEATPSVDKELEMTVNAYKSRSSF